MKIIFTSQFSTKKTIKVFHIQRKQQREKKTSAIYVNKLKVFVFLSISMNDDSTIRRDTGVFFIFK